MLTWYVDGTCTSVNVVWDTGMYYMHACTAPLRVKKKEMNSTVTREGEFQSEVN